MIEETTPKPQICDEDAEKASFAYLMSTIVLIVGLPFPIINMIATIIFYIANRKKTYFVRFHCLQSMLSQIFVIAMNTVGIWWTVSVIFWSSQITDAYLAYMITIGGFNILEFIASLYAAIMTRKKQDVRFWFFGPIIEHYCKTDTAKQESFNFF